MKSLGAVLLFIVNVVLYIFTLTQLYAWFLIPMGAPVISTAHVYGLAILITFITTRITKKDINKDNDTSSLNSMLCSIFRSLVVLLFAYITTLFM